MERLPEPRIVGFCETQALVERKDPDGALVSVAEPAEPHKSLDRMGIAVHAEPTAFPAVEIGSLDEKNLNDGHEAQNDNGQQRSERNRLSRASHGGRVQQSINAGALASVSSGAVDPPATLCMDNAEEGPIR